MAQYALLRIVVNYLYYKLIMSKSLLQIIEKECKVMMLNPYIEKFALICIVVLYYYESLRRSVK